ncbi:MAG: amidohydrolase [Proteobacteria bacterium]|nr:amidohydrolase [Pseudomonadota bacterium]
MNDTMIFTNGKIFTMDPRRPWVEAFALQSGYIVATGDKREVESKVGSHEVIDLGGRFVMPGFIDAHLHFAWGASYVEDIGVRQARTMSEVLAKLGDYAKKNPEKIWLVGHEFSYGYPDLEGGAFHKSMFDDVVSDRPVFFYSGMAHAAWVNSKALAAAGINSKTPDPEGGIIVRDEHGEPTGWLKESAVTLIKRLIPPATAEEVKAALKKALALAASCGITRVQSAGYDDHVFPILQELQQEGRLTCRFTLSSVIDPSADVDAKLAEMAEFRTAYNDDHIQFLIGKFFLDGVLESHTGYMPRGYADKPEETGVLLWKTEAYQNAVAKVQSAGFQVWTHAIGEGAIQIALDAYAADAKNSKSRRPRVEHVEIPRMEDIARFKEIGAIASLQPSMIYPKDEWLGMEGIWEVRAGKENLARAFPVRAILDTGGAVAFGTDWPIIDLNPLLGIRKAVVRQSIDRQPEAGWIPAQAVTVEDALHAYTLGAAYAGHREHLEGSISAGKLADIVILEGDPLTQDPQTLSALNVTATLVGGQLVYGTLPGYSHATPEL